MGKWNHIYDRFQTDDGSLPDFFIENLSKDDIRQLFLWIFNFGPMLAPIAAWDKKAENDILIESPKIAINRFLNDEIDAFRCASPDIIINSQLIPQLIIGVYGDERLEFDYRMGAKWTDKTILAFLEFLSLLKDNWPNVKILRAEEGCYSNPDTVFSDTFLDYYQDTRKPSKNVPF